MRQVVSSAESRGVPRQLAAGLGSGRVSVTGRKLFAAFISIALLLSATAGTALADTSGDVGTQFQLKLNKVGTTRLIGGNDSTDTGSGLVGERALDPGAGGKALLHGNGVPAPVPPTQAPKPRTQRVVDATGTTHFGGLNHYDQRVAGTGAFTNTQFSLEPPDQGLCVGNGFVVEAVNTVIRVRNAATGALITDAMPLNQFFKLAPEFQRTTPAVFGDFTSDPKCYFDSAAGGHWFVTLLQLGVNPTTSGFTGSAEQLIAVSTGSDPTGTFTLYTFDTTNDGSNGTPSHPGCPCFGDQPLMGADANGFYITTNEFSISGSAFNGAIVYAISKSALASGTARNVTGFWQPTLAEGQAYSVQPATTPPGGTYASENGGTEYFLSALEFTGGLDNRIALWSMTNTSTLNSAHPRLKMAVKVMPSEVYGAPPVVTQKNGPLPLRDFIGLKEPLPRLNSNDDRMNQTVYVDGQIWGALNTVIESRNGDRRVGIAWFAVQPSTGKQLDGSVSAEGYIAVDRNSVFFPSVTANKDGNVLVAFTLAGPNYYPSAAYALLDNWSDTGSVRVVSWGVGPADGFTGYRSQDPGDNGIERWGDYSAATADAAGNLWFATETINQSCTISQFAIDKSCGGTRTVLANWGTTIAKVRP